MSIVKKSKQTLHFSLQTGQGLNVFMYLILYDFSLRKSNSRLSSIIIRIIYGSKSFIFVQTPKNDALKKDIIGMFIA